MTRQAISIIVAVALAAASLYPSLRGTSLPPPPAPAPAPTTPAATDPALQRALSGVSAADRADLASLYGSLADAVESDEATVTTTRVLVDGIVRSIDLAFAGRRLSADGSLGEAIDAHMSVALGYAAGAVPDVVVTPALRSKAVAALRSVASNAAAR
jgi:hypothetical protein